MFGYCCLFVNMTAADLLIDSKPYTLELKNGDELDFPYEIVEGSVRREFFFFDMNTLEPLAKY